MPEWPGQFARNVATCQSDVPQVAIAEPRGQPAMLARLASALLHTLAIRSRAGEPRAGLEAMIDPALDLVCGKVGG